MRRQALLLLLTVGSFGLAPAMGCAQLLRIGDLDAGSGTDDGGECPAHVMTCTSACDTDLSQPSNCGGCRTMCSGDTPDCALIFGSYVCTSRASSGSSSGTNSSSSSSASSSSSSGASSGGSGSSSGGSSGASSDAGPSGLGFTPTNFDPTGLDAGAGGSSGIWSGARDVTNSLPAPIATIAMNDANATQADLYVLNSLVIDATMSLTVSGTRPAILAVRTTVDIQGRLFATAGAFAPGAVPGPGGGQGGALFPNSAGGGGSYCGVGGKATASMPPAAAGGATYGNPTLAPLLGGSVGGNYISTRGGGGGGAIQIVAGVSITVGQYGSVSAGGGGGTAGGGGSGGAILLEAPSVTIRGSLAANGGGGGVSGGNGLGATPDNVPAAGGGSFGGAGSAGQTINGGDARSGTSIASGGGGAGRIRINTAGGSAAITGVVSPDLGGGDGGADSGTTACATQGKIH